MKVLGLFRLLTVIRLFINRRTRGGMCKSNRPGQIIRHVDITPIGAEYQDSGMNSSSFFFKFQSEIVNIFVQITFQE